MESQNRYVKSEDNGRFFLSTLPGVCYYDGGGDFGRGGDSERILFHSAEAREYYIQMEHSREQAGRIEGKYEDLKKRLLKLLTPSGNIRRKRLMELIREVESQK